MQLDLFPGYALTSGEVKVEIENEIRAEITAEPVLAFEPNNGYEVLLYATTDNERRDLEIRVNSPEGNVVFSHINPDEQINVYIDGSTVVKGNLSITGDLLMNGKLTFVDSKHDGYVIHDIAGLVLKYDIFKNAFREIGKRVVESFRKMHDDLTFNDAMEFFSY